MTIQYASDLHLEFAENEFFIKNNPLTTGADILLLGGDILQFRTMKQHEWFFDYVSENFGATYWILRAIMSIIIATCLISMVVLKRLSAIMYSW